MNERIIYFLNWLGDIIASMFPWPFVVLMIALIIAFSPMAARRLRRLTGLFRKVSVGGVEIELGEDAKREVQLVAEEVSTVISNYNRQIQKDVATLVQNRDLGRRLEQFAEGEIKPHLDGQEFPEKFRCTIHVSDFAFSDRLYQLLGYYPMGGGEGRTYSVGYGIIGMVWRSGVAKVRGNLLEGNLQNLSDKEKRWHIASNWGSTLKQAYHFMRRPSFCCVPIRWKGSQIALLYFDSTAVDAFKTTVGDDKFLEKLKEGLEKSHIPEAIAQLMGKLENVSARISISDR